MAACGGKTSDTGDGGPPGGVFEAGVDAPLAEAGKGPGDAGPTDATPGDTGLGNDASDASEGGVVSWPPATPTRKIDLLFMVQNSAAMEGVGPYLQASVPELIDRLINPSCIDGAGNVVAASVGGVCATGTLEFQPIDDLHVGIVTSSLGGRGGDQCSASLTNPANPSLNAHSDDDGALVNRAGPTETALADALPSNFLAWFPNVPQNMAAPPPVDPAVAIESQLVGDFQQLLGDTGVSGCGLTAPLEAWYRFLVQPDPYASIVVGNNHLASYSGTDATILQQRHDFLRPDSALAIVLVVNENDRGGDPLTIGGQGWAFEASDFLGSPNGAAPEGTSACATDPESPSCTSCAFVQGMSNFATLCPNDPPGGTMGYLDPSDDALNLRFFHQKQRFGLDSQFPIARYVSALSSPTVPDGAHEHDGSGNYAPTPDCTNPIFAAALPANATQELCALPAGTRVPSQVFLAVIGGVPHQLLQQDPSNASSPQKAALSAADWTAILGADPLSYDFTGADFHMLESESARAQSACPPTAADDCDPINGRELDTNKQDLQFACVFPLAAPLDCTLAANRPGCACATGNLDAGTPLCQKDATGAYTTTQINGRAYPTIRQLSLARALPAQAVVGSLCPIHTTDATGSDPLYGYRPAFDALVDRMATALVK